MAKQINIPAYDNPQEVPWKEFMARVEESDPTDDLTIHEDEDLPTFLYTPEKPEPKRMTKAEYARMMAEAGIKYSVV